MKKILFFIALISILLSSCRLDSFLYDPTVIAEYQLDNLEDPPHFKLDDSYAISDSLVEMITLESGSSGSQETIYAFYIGDKSRINQDTVILYCHGNAGNIDYYWQRVKLMANAGGKNRFGVMIMDYRGYGRSTGKPTETGMYEDVDACMKWLKNKGLTNERLVMEGFSLGCAPATELMANPRSMKPCKLILEAPFASFEYLEQSIGKVSFPGSIFANLEVDNAAKIQKVQEPFLWIHGMEDDYVGIDNGRLVAQNYQGTKIIKREIPNAGHSTVPLMMGFEAYMKLLEDFITGAI